MVKAVGMAVERVVKMVGEAMVEVTMAEAMVYQMSEAVKVMAIVLVTAVEMVVLMAEETAMAEAAMAEAAMAEAMAEEVVRMMEMVVEGISEAVMAVEKAQAVKAMAMVIVMAVEMVWSRWRERRWHRRR